MKNVFRKAAGHEPKAEKIYKSRNLTDLWNSPSRCLKSLAYTFGLTLMMGIFTGCADELETGFNEVPENCLQLSFDIAQPDVVTTRGESDVNSLTVYVFNSEGTKCYEKQDFTGISSVVIPLTGEAINANKIIYAVANASGISLPGVTSATLAGVKGIELTANPSSDALVMNGETDVTGTGTASIQLKRVSAKMEMATISEDEYTVKGFILKNIASKGYVGATDTETDTYAFNTNGTKKEISLTTSALFYPSKGETSGVTDGAYLILAAEKSGQTYYYRVAIKTAEGNTEKNINLLANHHYSVSVTKINGNGYESPEEAIKHPDSDLAVVTIHDHSKNVLSMITDGRHELGVTYEVNTSNIIDSFVVRMYCPDSPTHLPNVKTGKEHRTAEINDFSVEIIEGESWLSISTYDNISSEDSENLGADQDSTPESGLIEGKSIRIRQFFSLNRNNITGGQVSGIIRVTWHGLSRDIKINYSTEFVPSNVAKDVYLIFNNTNTNGDTESICIREYWSFLANINIEVYKTDDDFNVKKFDTTKKLSGISANDMGSKKIRNQGFHFPVMYGENSQTSPWTYEYRIKLFNSNIIGSKYHYYSVSVKKGDNFVSSSDPIWGNDYLKIYEGKNNQDLFFNPPTKSLITRGNKIPLVDSNNQKNFSTGIPLIIEGVSKSYDYSLAQLVITLYANIDDTDGVDYPFNLYHTGFFHYDINLENFYYYEVIPVKVGNTTQYWLDRNLGATACGDYYENANSNNTGSNIFPTDSPADMLLQGSKGYYYKVANAGTNYGDPKMLESVCPPGYHVPTMSDFDVLRRSPNFVSTSTTTSTQTYYTTYYDTKDSHIGKIYFPRARYNTTSNGDYQLSSNMGDSGAGYYWTRTSSQGLEKDQIGNWLKVFNLNGASNTYINGDVSHKMSLRCISDASSKTESKNAVDINVHGATHVYLYSKEGDNRAGLYSFPGKAVGSQAAVDGLGTDEYIHFSANTTVNTNNLYVFFTYVTADGKISIIAASGNNLNDARGWKYVKGGNYKFTKSGESWDTDVPDGATVDN